MNIYSISQHGCWGNLASCHDYVGAPGEVRHCFGGPPRPKPFTYMTSFSQPPCETVITPIVWETGGLREAQPHRKSQTWSASPEGLAGPVALATTRAGRIWVTPKGKQRDGAALTFLRGRLTFRCLLTFQPGSLGLNTEPNHLPNLERPLDDVQPVFVCLQ